MLIKSEIERLKAAKEYVRQPYAWPGGYPQALITADGGCLCPECVKGNWREIVSASLHNLNDGWRVAGVGVNWENPDLYCDHCGTKLDAAYV